MSRLEKWEESQLLRERVIMFEDEDQFVRTICIVCKNRCVRTYELRLGSLVIGICKDCLCQIIVVIAKQLTRLASQGAD